jgi:hypothetical protein
LRKQCWAAPICRLHAKVHTWAEQERVAAGLGEVAMGARGCRQPKRVEAAQQCGISSN